MNGTGYFTHPDCRKHEMGRGHPECPERLDAIEDWLLATGVKDALDCRQAPEAPIADIELGHDRMMVAGIRGLGAQLLDDINAGGPAYASIDPDTTMNVNTWSAALHAAGAALAATETEFAAVDVLADPRIRQELSSLSNWPTIPQLFVRGELVGGADIVGQMYESGELAAVLGAPASAGGEALPETAAPGSAPPLQIENRLN